MRNIDADSAPEISRDEVTMEDESVPTASEQPRYSVQQYEQTFTNWSERDEATGENPVAHQSCKKWGFKARIAN